MDLNASNADEPPLDPKASRFHHSQWHALRSRNLKPYRRGTCQNQILSQAQRHQERPKVPNDLPDQYHQARRRQASSEIVKGVTYQLSTFDFLAKICISLAASL